MSTTAESQPAPVRAADYLKPDEIRAFSRRSDFAGAALLALNWLSIAAIFTLVALWTNPLTVLLAVLLLGARQLGLAVLMHEAGHRTLFANGALNDALGQWLAAYPVLGDCLAYGASHREHHRLAGTDRDPDLPNYRAYPIKGSSFRRKILRDVTGRTGMRLLLGQFTGAGNRIMMRDGEANPSLHRGLAVNAMLFGLLWVSGNPALYLLWIAAYVTSYPLVARIRQVAEHGAVPGLYAQDPRGNTRTTRAGVLERLLLCPNNVNFHIEHHLMPSVPCWRLPRLHRLLAVRGFYRDHPEAIASSYLDVIRRAVPEFGSGSATPA
ncbi:MAG: fatty acid desaturase family protein [Pseudomonadota bacterium]